MNCSENGMYGARAKGLSTEMHNFSDTLMPMGRKFLSALQRKQVSECVCTSLPVGGLKYIVSFLENFSKQEFKSWNVYLFIALEKLI